MRRYLFLNLSKSCTLGMTNATLRKGLDSSGHHQQPCKKEILGEKRNPHRL
jgi:hypothetical protein